MDEPQSGSQTDREGLPGENPNDRSASTFPKQPLTAQKGPEPKRKRGSGGFSFSFLQRVGAVQKIFFTQNLTVMIKAGFSLGIALETLVKQIEQPKLKSITSELRDDVEGGMTFADALKKHPRVFDEIFVSMIAAGESSGKLDEMLIRLTQQLRKQHELVSKVRNALTYPVIVSVAMVVLGIGVVVFIIPKISVIYTESGTALPLPTRILIGTSQFLIQNGVWVTLGTILFGFGLQRFLRTASGKLMFHALILRFPIMGPIVKKINLAQFTRTLASLLKTDIPIVTTFQIIARTLSNVHYQNAMLEAARKLKDGMGIVVSLGTSPKLFPPLVIQILGVGEQSGTLDDVSDDIAGFYEEEVEATMANLSTLIEPILILVLGVGIAFLAIAVLLPIYSLSEAIG